MQQHGKINPVADRITLGIGLGVLAYLLFGAHDATIKYLVAQLPVWQILFARSLLVLVGCCVIGRARLVEQVVRTPMKLALLLRGVITLAAWIAFYTAARSLPLAQLVTLYFAAPLVATMLASVLLSERVTGMRWIAVSVGFVGVMIASDPLGVRLSWPTIMVLMAACLWAYAIILMRQIARRESSLVQMVAGNLLFVIVAGAVSLTEWQPLQASQVWLLLAVAALGGIAQYIMFEAARHAPASVMATVEYSGLLWAFILGYAIFGDIPKTAVFAGAGLIVCAGVLLVGSERWAARRQAAQRLAAERGVAAARVR
jgi:drug/metabolite transporter (DMT)-like permease